MIMVCAGVELKNVKMSMNPFCENAMEEAVRLKVRPQHLNYCCTVRSASSCCCFQAVVAVKHTGNAERMTRTSTVSNRDRAIQQHVPVLLMYRVVAAKWPLVAAYAQNSALASYMLPGG